MWTAEESANNLRPTPPTTRRALPISNFARAYELSFSPLKFAEMSQSRNPMFGVIVKKFLENRPRQIQPLDLFIAKLHNFAGCQKLPVANVSGAPFFQQLGNVGVRVHVEIGAIEDAV